MSKYRFGTEPAPTIESGQATCRYTHAQILEFSAPRILDCYCTGSPIPVTAKLLKDSVPEFEDYKVANAIGDALSPNNDGGMRLYHIPGKSPRTYPPCFENASLVFDFMSEDAVKEYAANRGLTVDEIVSSIEELARFLR